MWFYQPINEEIIKSIQNFSNPFFDKFFQIITMMGEEYVLVVLMVIIFWCVNKELGYRLGFICLTSIIINTIVKDLFMVTRPIGEEGIRSLRIETATGYSFPSGHTQIVSTLWVTLMLYIKKNWIYVTGTIIIILVGISRLYLGVHRPVDVLGGVIIAVIWVIICNALLHYAEKDNKKYLLLFILIPIIIGMFFTKSPAYYKIEGIFIGFYVGYLIEPKYIEFDVKGKYNKQLVKIVIGLGIFFILKITLKNIFMQTLITDLLRYFMLGLWLTIGAPLVFKKIKDRLH